MTKKTEMITDETVEKLKEATAEAVEKAKFSPSPLKKLFDTKKSLEKARIQMQNRMSAMARGVDGNEEPVPEIYTKVTGVLEAAEELVEKEMLAHMKTYRVYEHWLKHVKGMGPLLGSQLLALLLPPTKEPQRGPSIWYKAAGLIPEERPDGTMRLPRPRVGEGKITYHPKLRTLLFNVGESFVKTGGDGYYRSVYDKAKNTLKSQHADDPKLWTPIRVERTARWMTVKRFLSHLWEKWLESEGMVARTPYAVEKLGHSYQAPPEPRQDGKKI